MSDAAVVVPWHNRDQLCTFLKKWNVDGTQPPWLILQQDAYKEGCAHTKNKGVARATSLGYEMVVVLDDDCYPTYGTARLEALVEQHREALKPQPVRMFDVVTDPPSRGTPYFDLTLKMPVAASMGFWVTIGDHCAVRALATGNAPMTCFPQTIHGRYFPLCGMNLAFYPKVWNPWCRFVDVARFDDIWMGWLWQREAYARGYCFNLAGPVVSHERQSDVWRNLKEEAAWLRESETLWRDVATCPSGDYESLSALLPHARPKEDAGSLAVSRVVPPAVATARVRDDGDRPAFGLEPSTQVVTGKPQAVGNGRS